MHDISLNDLAMLGAPKSACRKAELSSNGLPTIGQSSRKCTPRMLLRPRPGFYVMRPRGGAPLIPALIYQLCPMVVPQRTTVDGPNPEEWRRPLNRSAHFGALIDGKPVAVDRVWKSRSLRPVSPDELRLPHWPLAANSITVPEQDRRDE
jgi:hypothetical protein